MPARISYKSAKLLGNLDGTGHLVPAEGLDFSSSVFFTPVPGSFVATPLFQIDFFPDFTHVNFLPPITAVFPILGQAEPAFAAATE
jgi:hypothetical protein